MAQRVFAAIVLIVLPLCVCPEATRVVELGSKLPEFVDQHADKSWIVKFYAPWCYHCQQLETTFNNVAEDIYHKHDDLVVGRVDCTKHMSTCEKYNIQAYPVIMFINQNTRIKYSGERNKDSIIDFAERLKGPNIKRVNDCDHLKSAVNSHGHIILSTAKNRSSKVYKEFKSLASQHKATWWFYHFDQSCKNYIAEEGLYILKRYLNRAIKFMPKNETEDLNNSITEWLARESFPVYSQLSWVNYNRAMSSGKLLVIAVLDEYKPAKQIARTSKDLHKKTEKIAKKISQIDEDLLFFWSTDLELIQSIVIGKVLVPNVMILKPDYKYLLLVNDQSDLDSDKDGVKLDAKLQERSIKIQIAAAKLDEQGFSGGNSYLHVVLRYFYTQFYRFFNIYKSDPLLTSILIVFPSLILLFVIYTTCIYDKYGDEEQPLLNNDDDDEDDSSDEEREQQHLINHVKQD